MKLYGPILNSILSAIFASLGSYAVIDYQFKAQRHAETVDRASMILNETAELLFSQYDDLKDLVEYSKEANDPMNTPKEFYDSFDNWRQQLLVKRFEIKRYFSEDMADMLINYESYMAPACEDERTCNMDQDPYYDFISNAWSIIRDSTMIKIHNYMMDENPENISNYFEGKSEAIDKAHQDLEMYEKSIVQFMSAAEERLTAIGKPEFQYVFREK